MRISEPSPAPRINSEEITPSHRSRSRVSGIESGCSGRIRENSGAGRGEALPRTPARSPQPTITPTLGSDEKLDHIRRKIASGYYSTAGHLEELADVLMERIDFLSPEGDDDIPDSKDD